jgi:hypothetical protein
MGNDLHFEPSLRMIQHSALNGFKYDFLNYSGEAVGGFEFAFFVQAKNARLRVYEDNSKGAIQVTLHGRKYLVHHFYTRRGFTNDVLYTLENEEGEELAGADVLVATSQQRLPRIILRNPFSAELGVSKSFFRRCYSLIEDNTMRALAVIEEPAAVSLKRQLAVSLHKSNDPLAAFLAIITLCVRY